MSAPASSLFQNGGASQLDTFDPKPDAPADIKGSLDPFRLPYREFISRVCCRAREILNRFAVIRSIHSDEAIHERARQYYFQWDKAAERLAAAELRSRHLKGARPAKWAAAVCRDP